MEPGGSGAHPDPERFDRRARRAGPELEHRAGGSARVVGAPVLQLELDPHVRVEWMGRVVEDERDDAVEDAQLLLRAVGEARELADDAAVGPGPVSAQSQTLRK
jgi:hypothetical protein